MTTTPQRRVTVNDVREAMRQHPEWKLAPCVCRSDKAKLCCGLGALYLDQPIPDDPKYSDDPEQHWVNLFEDDFGSYYAQGFMDGFDGNPSDPFMVKSKKYQQGYEDGESVRNAEDLPWAE